MFKKWLITLFCFGVAYSALAQLQNDLSFFASRLTTLASMLTAKVVPPPLAPSGKPVVIPPKGIDIKVPSSGGAVNLPNGDVVVVPSGSTVKQSDEGPIVIVPATGGNVKLSTFGGFIGVTSDSRVQLPDGSIQEILAGGYVHVEDEGTVKVTPKGVVPPPLIPPALPPRKTEDVLKQVGNVTQLRVPAFADAQALSGYVSVYYGLSELLRADGKVIALSFNDFLQPALRSIKKRRIQVACKNYIANIITKPPYLVPENLLPELKTPGFKLTFKQVRSIYHSLLSDLAGEIAATYVQDNYVKGTTVDQDKLRTSKVVLKNLPTAFKNFVDKRRDYYAQQLKVAAAALSALIDQPAYLQNYANITDATTIEFDTKNVLSELHQPTSFAQEEGTGGQAMSTGRWLQSGDITHLVGDTSVVQAVGLPNEKISDERLSIFDDLSLLKVDLEQILTQTEEIQGKYFINQQILERIARESKNSI